MLSFEDAFLKAKELLEKRYGDSFVIANAFRNKLDGWPKYHRAMVRDCVSLVIFSISVILL